MKSNDGFDSESELSGEDAGFVVSGITDDEVFEDEEIEVPFVPPVAEKMAKVVEAKAKRAASEGEEREGIEIPSFFDLPEVKNSRVFEDDESSVKKLPSKEGRISIDLDNDDPVDVAATVKDMYLSSCVKADVCSYVGASGFEEISFKDLFELVEISPDVPNKTDYLLDTIEKLAYNQNLRAKRELLEKLYKLRPMKVLIKEALSADDAHAQYRELKRKIKELLVKWEALVKEKIAADLRSRASFPPVSASAQNEEAEVLREEKDALSRELARATAELREVLIVKEMHESLLSGLHELLELDDAQGGDEIISLLKERLSQSGGNFDVELGSLKEEIELLRETGGDTEQQLREAQEKEQTLREQNEKLESEISRLEALLLQVKEQGKPAEADEDEEVEEDESEEDGEVKKSSPLKKIVIGALLVFAVLGSFSLFVGWFIGDDESLASAAPASYATPVAAPAATVSVAKAEVKPAVAEAAATQTAPATVAEEAGYDFVAVLKPEEFRSQKFDIYSDNFKKIRVNGMDFFKDDVVNGYRFIKATSSGKILFIDTAGEPLWVEMK